MLRLRLFQVFVFLLSGRCDVVCTAVRVYGRLAVRPYGRTAVRPSVRPSVLISCPGYGYPGTVIVRTEVSLLEPIAHPLLTDHFEVMAYGVLGNADCYLRWQVSVLLANPATSKQPQGKTCHQVAGFSLPGRGTIAFFGKLWWQVCGRLYARRCGRFGHALPFRPHFVRISSAFRPHFVRILSAFCPHFVRISSAFRPHFVRISSAFCPHFVRSSSAFCPHFVRILSAGRAAKPATRWQVCC